MNTPPPESNWYHEEADVQYHAHVFSGDDFVRATIARNRALKLQPLIDESDRVLEYGVGIGLNLRDLRCRERVGFDLSGYGREVCEAAGIDFTNKLDDLSGRRFDKVICHHVLEHVPGRWIPCASSAMSSSPADNSSWWCRSSASGVSTGMTPRTSIAISTPGIP